MTYTVSSKSTGKSFTVEASTYEQASQIAVKRLYPRATVATRCTGDPGKSGLFQGYRSGNSVGDNFHIM